MKKMTFLAACVIAISSIFAYKIDQKTGIYSGMDCARVHFFDHRLSGSLQEFFKNENAETIVDFGCGMGKYVQALRKSGFDVEGYDGNPDTPALSSQTCGIQDLSVPFDLGKKFDWVLSLEVGEHIPKTFESVFIDNLVRHCKKGIVLSWAVKGQGGNGHFNCQNNDYIKAIFADLGFENDEATEKKLRQNIRYKWFRNTIMVFKRPT